MQAERHSDPSVQNGHLNRNPKVLGSWPDTDSVPKRTRLASIGLILLAVLDQGCIGDGKAPHDIAPDLVLTEEHATIVPPDFRLTGVFAKGRQVRAIWSRSESLIRWQPSRGDTATVVARDLPDGIVAVSVEGENLHVAMTHGGLTMSTSGKIVRDFALPVGQHLLDATWIRSGWLLLIQDADSTVKLLDARGTAIRRAFADSAGSPVVRRLTKVAPGLVAVAALRAPFVVDLLSTSGDLLQSMAPPIEDLDVPDTWISLPFLPLDSAYLQTLSDLKSNRRRIVLYNHRGQVVRVRDIELPLGFVHSDVSSSTLLAVRRTDVTEIVEYRWRWRQ